MDDIVKRLRAPAYWMSGSSEGHEGENSAPLDAADEITALRAENERLKEELSIWQSVFPDIAPERVLPDRSKLEAKVEKLRAALEMFACDCVENDLCKFPHACRNYVARAALGGKDE